MLLDMLEQRQYKRNYKPPKEEIVLRIDDKVVGTLENIISFTGLPKAGKSTFIHSCIASAFNRVHIFSMKLTPPKSRPIVCYIDTESSQHDFYRGIERIKYLAEDKADLDSLHAYCFRDLNPQEIRNCIDYYLASVPKCSVMIIDGLLDTLMNYNDETESRMCIDWLKKITKKHNILVVGVVHVGKSNLQTLGTFGSMIDRYAQSVLLVEKKAGLFEMKPKFMRSDADFGTVVIGREKNGFVQQ